jgi:hypothetical protein
MTNTILDQAEQRVATGAQTVRGQEAQIIDEMRREIGLEHYVEAKRQLPFLEGAMARTFRPWLHQLAALEAKSGTPLPGLIRSYVEQLTKQADSAPAQLRAGIQDYEALSVRAMLWTDGRSVDRVVRAGLVLKIRAALRTHDGRLSAMENMKASIEAFIVENGWPAVQR